MTLCLPHTVYFPCDNIQIAGDPTANDLEEIQRPQAEVLYMQEPNDILKQASIFFARELCATRCCVSRGGDRPSWLGRRSGLIKLGQPDLGNAGEGGKRARQRRDVPVLPDGAGPSSKARRYNVS